MRDNKDDSGIPGVTVEVNDAGNKVQRDGVSGSDGAYKVTGLVRGASVTASYKKLGYVPNPKVVPKDLAGAENQQDVYLFRNTDEVVYWNEWGGRAAMEIKTRGGDSKNQSELFAREWKKVDDAGLSVGAKVRAAQALSAEMPSNTEVPGDIRAYSSVDINLIPAAQSEIGAAFSTGGKIDPQKSQLPTTVYVDIAAEEFAKQKPNNTKTAEFRRALLVVCGSECVSKFDAELSQRLPH